MMMLVIGGSGSGKSDYAENVMEQLSIDNNLKKYYIATMQAFDAESCKKIDRHRRRRDSKHFLTLEQPRDIFKALEKMAAGNKAALLECVSNLTANEMFLKEETKTEEQVTQKVIKEIKILKKELTHLVVVSNDVFADGTSYDKDVMEYIQAMGKINRMLAAMADKVVEVVVGIPVIVK